MTRLLRNRLVLVGLMAPIVWASAGTVVMAQTTATLVRVYQGSTTAPAVTISVAPSSASIAPGATVQFAASVTGTTNTSVVWTATGGTISTAGLYAAGQTAGTYRITATISGGTISGSAAVTIGNSGSDSVDISPGQDIQAQINSFPNGTAFRLKAGVHRLRAPLVPRGGNVFVGESGTVVSGARLLTTFSRSGSYWVVDGQTQQGEVHGACEAAYPRCSRPEDLYIDDIMLQHVSSLAGVGPGKWYFDYDGDRIFFYDDPTGRRVETTVTRHAFGGSAPHVTISQLVIEKFANPAQAGAIEGDHTSLWTVQNNEVRFNHGVGIRLGHGMKVVRNAVHRNGQLGVGGVGDDVLVEQNTIAYNNTAHHSVGWEAGGTKFVNTLRLVVRGNQVHHNDGPGLWTDINNRDTLYENNTVEDNTGNGIFHEVSYAAIIRNNVVRRNGKYTGLAWSGGAGIVVAASPNVQIYGNSLASNANGIIAIQQNRANEGAYGQTIIENLDVRDNAVLTSSGTSAGLLQDINDSSYFTSRNNRFQNNDYQLGTVARPFAWSNQDLEEQQWQSYGQDTLGSFTR